MRLKESCRSLSKIKNDENYVGVGTDRLYDI